MAGFAGAPDSLTYGYNHWLVDRDSSIVSRAFPKVEGLNLCSPVFLTNDTQPGFANGTQAATSLEDLGMSLIEQCINVVRCN
jgi:hypothetical protein